MSLQRRSCCKTVSGHNLFFAALHCRSACAKGRQRGEEERQGEGEGGRGGGRERRLDREREGEGERREGKRETKRESARVSLTAGWGEATRGFDLPIGLPPQGQHTASTRSARGQLTVSTRSARGQLTASTCPLACRRAAHRTREVEVASQPK